MSLSELQIHSLRSISHARLALHPRFNVFYGKNGSGKTSLLEAIYLLGNGVSFRTRDIDALVALGKPALTVFARRINDETLSIQKSKEGVIAKLNQNPCYRRSELAYFLPCQIFYQDIFDIIDAGPSVRRNVLDWGLFHVKHDYHVLWKEYRRVLKQRNALLRQKANQELFVPWDKQLVELSELIHPLREAYCEEWFALFNTILSSLTQNVCQLYYEKGWDKKRTGKSLASILKEQFEMDKMRQFTHSGAHQADILFDSVQLKTKQSLSRGQQKIILLALKLAQAQLLNKPCIYLFDDITTELDLDHIGRFLFFLMGLEGQFYFTSLDPSIFRKALDNNQVAFFSIEHGEFMLESPE
jgi:DNA replication and repair protein RecF